jgi:hypothetical protein
MAERKRMTKLMGLVGLGLLVLLPAAAMVTAGPIAIGAATGAEQLAATITAELPVRYTFSGVTDDGAQGASDRKEATSIHCTNLSRAANQVEVQIFQWSGALVYTSTVGIASYGSMTFSTQNTTIYFDDVVLNTDAIFQGSGRILSSSPRIICTVQVLDPLGYPPVFMDKLALYTGDGYPVGEPRAVYLPVLTRGG